MKKIFLAALLGVFLVPLGCSDRSSSLPGVRPIPIQGSVFIVNKLGAGMKLGLVPIYVMTESKFSACSNEVQLKMKQEIREVANILHGKEILSSVKNDGAELLYGIAAEKLILAFSSAPAAKTDADGIFEIKLNSRDPVVLVAFARRELEKIETFLWCKRILPNSAEKIILSNDNLLRTVDDISPNTLSTFGNELQELDKIKAEFERKRLAEIKRKDAEALRLQVEHERDRQQEKQKAKQKAIQDRLDQEAKRLAEIAERALTWNQKQAEKGDAYGQFRMGMRYLTGEGVPQNEATGIDWLKKAAAQGHSDAKKALAEH